MFFRKNPIKSEISKAKELLNLAQKIYAFRKDLLTKVQLENLVSLTEALKGAVEAKKSVHDVRSAREALDKVMKECGGSIYPVGFWSDNVETFLVAAILAIGIRTFFFQPFVIPTNSMYPTYYGMTHVTHVDNSEKPGLVSRLWNKVKLGATHFEVEAQKSGELVIPLTGEGQASRGPIKFEVVTGRKWFGLLPERQREYTFFVGGSPVKVRVPLEFDALLEVFKETYYPGFEDFRAMFVAAQAMGEFELTSHGAVWKTGKQLKAGEDVLNFDILQGDMLFVNRIAYNFKKPKIGDPIVFRTEKIEGMRHADGSPEEKYFIKRLVGWAGDELEVKEPVLYSKGKPIEGAPAFIKNAKQEGLYPGYTARWDLRPGKTVKIEDGHFYAMGDNSPHSSDSREWGQVPQKEAVGKACFIFYPFSSRWGISE